MAVDLNPRWQGSTALATQAELLSNRLPLAVAELAWKLNLVSASELASYREQFFEPLEWSQMILRSLESQPSCVRSQMSAGLYRAEDRDIHLVQSGCDFGPYSMDEYLLAGSVVRQGKSVDPEARLATIFRRGAVYDPDGNCLTPEAASVASSFYKGFDLS
jgi:hypothetical protein